MPDTSRNKFLGSLEERVSQGALDHGGCAPYPLQFLWIMLQYLV